MGKLNSTGKYKILDINASDGTETAIAISLTKSSTTDGKILILARHAVAKSTGVVWPAGLSDAEIKAVSTDLENYTGILIR